MNINTETPFIILAAWVHVCTNSCKLSKLGKATDIRSLIFSALPGKGSPYNSTSRRLKIFIQSSLLQFAF